MPSVAAGKARDGRSSRSRRSNSPQSSDKPSPSPSKKQKRDENYKAPSTPLRTQTAAPDNMYKFTSNLIDLTSPNKSSPNGSPSNRRAANGIRTTNAAPNSGPKKLIVKNFRTTTKSDPEQYFNTTWKELEDALNVIFSKDVKTFSMEHLYRGVENICRQEKASKLFLKLQARCKIAIAGVKNDLSAAAKSKSDTEVLSSVVEAWTIWRRQMTTTCKIFYYLDRSYLLHSQTLPSLEEFGIKEFRENIFNDPSLQSKVLNGACELVSQDRGQGSGGKFAPTLFKDAVAMFHTLTTYTKNFEPLLLKKSQEFFDDWAKQNSISLTLSDYVCQCEAMFRSEIERCQAFALDDSTKRSLVTQMELSLVESQKSRLVRIEDVKTLLKESDVDALRSLYDLLEMRRLGDELEEPLVQYIYEDGESIIFDEDKPSLMVERLLYLKKKLDYICDSAFGKNPELAHSVREAFAVFMNKTKKTKSTWNTDNDKPGEMIAKYVDAILKGGSRAIPKSNSTAPAPVNEDDMDDDNDDANEESQINQQLDQVLDLFRFVNGKAVFEAFYKKDLAKRLLMNRSASADAEKSMLDKLSRACGQGFTQNLETMFKDIELAREENASYKMLLEDSGRKPSIDLSVNVLSAAAWPTYPTIDVVIPRDVNRAIEDFQTYYRSKHKGRMLDWKHSLAHCQMKARFPGGDKDIIVSSFQAIVMLYFNGKADGEAVTYQELSAATRLPDVELKRTLQSLACAKYRVLTKSPKSKDVNETDNFVVNLKFTDDRTRIKINQIQLKETREENKQTHERVAADRQYETQAAIVRIMKSKKRVKHNNLVLEVIEALKSRGNVSPEDIKTQIGKLIEKDYMERADDDEQSYEYIS